MKDRKIARLMPSLVALLLGAVVFSVEIYGQAAPDRTQSKDICVLQSETQDHIGETVLTNAEYVAGFEMGWLQPVSACPNVGERKAIHYLTDKDFEAVTDRKVYKTFQKRLHQRRDPVLPKTARGVFQVVVERYAKANEMDTRFEFQIRILKVLSVE